MNAGAVIVTQQRRAVRRFVEENCTSAEEARSFEELGVRRNFAIHSLVRRGVIKEANSGCYWVDIDAWSQFQARRERFSRIVLGIGIVVVIVLLLVN